MKLTIYANMHSQDKIGTVPLSYREDRYDAHIEKEPFCLFVGTMTQERKNVGRLIAAAKKYGFRLVLAGSPGNAASERQLRKERAASYSSI